MQLSCFNVVCGCGCCLLFVDLVSTGHWSVARDSGGGWGGGGGMMLQCLVLVASMWQ